MKTGFNFFKQIEKEEDKSEGSKINDSGDIEL